MRGSTNRPISGRHSGFDSQRVTVSQRDRDRGLAVKRTLAIRRPLLERPWWLGRPCWSEELWQLRVERASGCQMAPACQKGPGCQEGLLNSQSGPRWSEGPLTVRQARIFTRVASMSRHAFLVWLPRTFWVSCESFDCWTARIFGSRDFGPRGPDSAHKGPKTPRKGRAPLSAPPLVTGAHPGGGGPGPPLGTCPALGVQGFFR